VAAFERAVVALTSPERLRFAADPTLAPFVGDERAAREAVGRRLHALRRG
jgi:hypothetical protein